MAIDRWAERQIICTINKMYFTSKKIIHGFTYAKNGLHIRQNWTACIKSYVDAKNSTVGCVLRRNHVNTDVLLIIRAQSTRWVYLLLIHMTLLKIFISKKTLANELQKC